MSRTDKRKILRHFTPKANIYRETNACFVMDFQWQSMPDLSQNMLRYDPVLRASTCAYSADRLSKNERFICLLFFLPTFGLTFQLSIMWTYAHDSNAVESIHRPALGHGDALRIFYHIICLLRPVEDPCVYCLLHGALLPQRWKRRMSCSAKMIPSFLKVP